MDYEKIVQKRNQYQAVRDSIPELTLQSYENAFEIEYTHNSTAIEGNTLTLMETKVLLEEGISIGGKQLRELYEAVNHQKAYRYVKECIAKELPLNEKIIKDIHVYISGAQHTPPSPGDMYRQVKDFYADLAWKGSELNQMELAAWIHAEFVRIHPFPDGNGRTSRLLMNYQLMANGFPPISIAKENRLEYFNALEDYAVQGNLTPFAEMVANLTEHQLDCYLNMAGVGQGM